MRYIFDKLKERENIIDFKMPGHKDRFPLKDLVEIDETETYGTDNLHDPQGVIRESMDQAARIFSTRKTIYMVNGSTGALQAAIMSQVKRGERILIQRNSHMSIYHAIAMKGLRPSYLYPKNIRGVNQPIDLEELRKALDQARPRALVLTYPSYEGYGGDLKAMVSMAHARGVLVIVDEAHGAHLKFTDRLIPSSIDQGADLVVQSTHKSLPALTQTALLHVNSERVDEKSLGLYTRMLETSSPSYVFMASIEKALDYMAGEGKKRLDRSIDYIEDFYARARSIDSLIFPATPGYDKDISKIHFGIEGMDGTSLAKILFDKYKVNMEYADPYYCLAIAGLMNEKEDFDLLYQALKDLADLYGRDQVEGLEDLSTIRAKALMPMEEAMDLQSRPVSLDQAVGKLSASFVVPYPPGQVLLAPGERIERDHIELIKAYQAKGIAILNTRGELDVVDE